MGFSVDAEFRGPIGLPLVTIVEPTLVNFFAANPRKNYILKSSIFVSSSSRLNNVCGG